MNCISESNFDEKYERYKSLIFRIGIVYLGNRSDAEGLMQDVFVKLFYKAPKFFSAEEEKAWMIKVTVNCCKNMCKSYWKRKVELTCTFDDIPDLTKADQMVLEELAALDPGYRTVIYLHYMEGYKIVEIAEMLKLSPSAVKMRLSRGREMLKTSLREEFI